MRIHFHSMTGSSRVPSERRANVWRRQMGRRMRVGATTVTYRIAGPRTTKTVKFHEPNTNGNACFQAASVNQIVEEFRGRCKTNAENKESKEGRMCDEDRGVDDVEHESQRNRGSRWKRKSFWRKEDNAKTRFSKTKRTKRTGKN